jgi:uncharacterized protein (TIGR02271 family)
VPLDAVARTDDADRAVYLDTTKDRIESMGWDAPPMSTSTTDRGYGTTDSGHFGGTTAGTASGDVDRERLALHEEELQAQTRRQQAGEVSVSKRVVEDQQQMDVPVTHDEVDIKRVRVDRDAAPGDAAFTEDRDTVRVPVTAETVEVTKTPKVVEEIEISKRPVTERQRVSDTVRREEAEIDRQGDVVMGEGDRDLVRSGSDRFQRTSIDDVENLTDEERAARGL